MKKRTFGAEREWFIFRDNKIVPAIDILLPALQAEAKRLNGCDNPTDYDLIHPKLATFYKKYIYEHDRFGFELFAGQVEDRTHIVESISELIDNLKVNEEILLNIGADLDLNFALLDYVTEEELGELVANPFSERHKLIWSKISHEQKVGASQVAAIHIHISVDEDEVVPVLNYCRRDIIDKLAALGDFSQGKRLSGYRVMANTYGDSPLFRSYDDVMKYIQDKGGERDVWDMVRYKPSTKTIEFRMYGATPNYELITKFVEASLEVINSSL